MKTLKWFFLISAAVVVFACGDDSEEQLVGNWNRRSPFYTGGRAYTSTFVIDNKGYVCCGYSGTNLQRKDMYVFDPTEANGQGSWGQVKDFGGRKRQQAVGFAVNGKGYVGTGWDGDEKTMRDFWRYNPATDSWDSIAPLPSNASVRRDAIAFSLKVNGKEYGYVGTGFTGTPDNAFLYDFWQLDPDGTTIGDKGENLAGKWTQVTGYGGGKRAGAVVFIIDNKAYICLGTNASGTISDFWVFDPDGNAKDSSKPLWSNRRNLSNTNPDEDYDDDYGDLVRPYGVAFTMPVNGQVRGHIAIGLNKSSVWEYDHENDLWTQRTYFVNNSTKQSREGGVSFTFPALGRAFVGMGKSGGSFADDIWEFEPMVEDVTYNDYQ